MTTTEAKTCEFTWCEGTYPDHLEHSWTDGAPAKVGGESGSVYVYGVVYDGDQFGDEILIGIKQDGDESAGGEGWLSISDAEYLRDVLAKAVRYARREQQR